MNQGVHRYPAIDEIGSRPIESATTHPIKTQSCQLLASQLINDGRKPRQKAAGAKGKKQECESREQKAKRLAKTTKTKQNRLPQNQPSAAELALLVLIGLLFLSCAGLAGPLFKTLLRRLWSARRTFRCKLCPVKDAESLVSFCAVQSGIHRILAGRLTSFCSWLSSLQCEPS